MNKLRLAQYIKHQRHAKEPIPSYDHVANFKNDPYNILAKLFYIQPFEYVFLMTRMQYYSSIIILQFIL